MISHPPCASANQSSKEILSGRGVKANPVQKEEPKFSCEEACQHKVINIFFLLVTERGSRWDMAALFVLTDQPSNTSHGPLAIRKNSICQAPKFPKSYHKDWKLQYHETGFHRRLFAEYIAHHWRTSNMRVFHLWLKHQFEDEIPKCEIFSEENSR